MRAFALGLLLLLAGCGQPEGWHATDITGAMPKLNFGTMIRANDGKPVTAADYSGKVTVLFFGYTHCPDVCPFTLSNLTNALDKLGSKRDDVRILFVSVDPDRDTAGDLKNYAHAFAPQIDALRADPNTLVSAARRYRVAYSVKKGPPYVVSHSGAVFFFDETGRARLVTTDVNDIDAVAADLKRLLG